MNFPKINVKMPLLSLFLSWEFLINANADIPLIWNTCYSSSIRLAWAWVDLTFDVGTIWFYVEQYSHGRDRSHSDRLIQFLVEVTCPGSMLSLLAHISCFNDIFPEVKWLQNKILDTDYLWFTAKFCRNIIQIYKEWASLTTMVHDCSYLELGTL